MPGGMKMTDRQKALLARVAAAEPHGLPDPEDPWDRKSLESMRHEHVTRTATRWRLTERGARYVARFLQKEAIDGSL